MADGNELSEVEKEELKQYRKENWSLVRYNKWLENSEVFNQDI